MNFSELPPDPAPADHSRVRKVPLRHFVIGIVATGMGMFVWYRTGEDMLLSMIFAAMTAATVDVRVSDSPSK